MTEQAVSTWSAKISHCATGRFRCQERLGSTESLLGLTSIAPYTFGGYLGGVELKKIGSCKPKKKSYLTIHADLGPSWWAFRLSQMAPLFVKCELVCHFHYASRLLGGQYDVGHSRYDKSCPFLYKYNEFGRYLEPRRAPAGQTQSDIGSAGSA